MTIQGLDVPETDFGNISKVLGVLAFHNNEMVPNVFGLGEVSATNEAGSPVLGDVGFCLYFR